MIVQTSEKVDKILQLPSVKNQLDKINSKQEGLF